MEEYANQLGLETRERKPLETIKCDYSWQFTALSCQVDEDLRIPLPSRVFRSFKILGAN